MALGSTVKGVRGADGALRTIKDIGEYDVWSTVVPQSTPAGQLMAFNYSIGGNVSGTAVAATRKETNMRTANSFIDESMNVYAIAIQIMRTTPTGFEDAAAVPAGDFVTQVADFISLETYTLFQFHVGGEKPFAEGRITWFGEAGGWYGNSLVNNARVMSNNVPSAGAARKWEYTLPIGRIEKFWGQFSWPQAAEALSVIPGTATAGRVGLVCRLLGIRARGVQ